MKPTVILQSEIAQQSDEWMKFRSEGIGSSDIGVLMGVNKYKSMRKLWLEKTGLQEPVFEESEAVKYGKHLEPYAVREYEWESGVTGFQPCLFIHPKYSFIRASLDAYHFDLKYALEIKCPYNPKNIEHATRGEVDPKYWPQLQWIMLASQTSFIKYCVYSGTKLWVIHVSEDKKYQRKMIRYVRWFWHQVQTKTDPKRRKFKRL